MREKSCWEVVKTLGFEMKRGSWLWLLNLYSFPNWVGHSKKERKSNLEKKQRYEREKTFSFFEVFEYEKNGIAAQSYLLRYMPK